MTSLVGLNAAMIAGWYWGVMPSGERLIAQAFSCDLTDVAGALEPLLARLAGEDTHE